MFTHTHKQERKGFTHNIDVHTQTDIQYMDYHTHTPRTIERILTHLLASPSSCLAFLAPTSLALLEASAGGASAAHPHTAHHDSRTQQLCRALLRVGRARAGPAWLSLVWFGLLRVQQLSNEVRRARAAS